MTTHFVTWWNVENLFDVHNSTDRPDWLQRQLRSELKGWNSAIVNAKIKQLASVISALNEGRGPDILGVCEVENVTVLELLLEALNPLRRSYEILHTNSDDQRGIDIAFIIDSDKYSHDNIVFSHEVVKRSATRDLVQVNLTTEKGNELILIGNHWPSRLAGQYESEPYRIIAAETLSYWMERIADIKGKDAAVLVMGDFNDEPHSRSMTDYALSSGNRKRVVYARNPMLYNLMWPLMGSNTASYYHGGTPVMLDQFLANKAMVKTTARLAVDETATSVIKPEAMTTGRYGTPKRFGRPSKSHDADGFSDHFPICTILKEKG